jgi:hypothetical protein
MVVYKKLQHDPEDPLITEIVYFTEVTSLASLSTFASDIHTVETSDYCSIWFHENNS